MLVTGCAVVFDDYTSGVSSGSGDSTTTEPSTGTGATGGGGGAGGSPGTTESTGGSGTTASSTTTTSTISDTGYTTDTTTSATLLIGTNISLGCKAGTEVVVGFALRTGAQVDQIAVACTKINADDTLDPGYTLTAAAGGPGGSAKMLLCPAGQAVAQWAYSEENGLVYSIAIGCAEPAAYKAGAASNPLSAPVGGAGGVSQQWGCPSSALGKIQIDTKDDLFVGHIHDEECFPIP
jgi:hypothetical protein